MSDIKDWSVTAASNNSAAPDGAPEGMAPSSVNDTMRENMAATRRWTDDGGWHDWGHTTVYATSTSFTIAGVDVTSIYHLNRRVRAVGSITGTIYGSISATAFSTNTTVTVTWDSGSLTSETLAISVGFLDADNKAYTDTDTDTDTTYTAGNGLNLSSTTISVKDQVIIVACSDEITALETGTGKVELNMPVAFEVTGVGASLTTAQTSGDIITVDINDDSISILSTKITIDNTEKTSATAATAPVISSSTIAAGSVVTFDLDQIGDSTAKGLKAWLVGYAA